MSADIVRELLDGCVAALRFFAHRLQHDVIQVAAQQFGIWNLEFGTSIASGDGRAWSRRFLFADDARDLSRTVSLNSIRTLPCQQLIENHAQTVNISRSCHQFATNLF